MGLNEKSRRLLTLAAIVFILLGLGLQGLLIWQKIRFDAARGETAAAMLEVYTQNYVSHLEGARIQGLEDDSAYLAEQSARRRALKDAEHPELLLLVNPWNPIPADYAPQGLVEVGYHEAEDYQMDGRCADALLQMLDDCRAEGLVPYICSAYRTNLYQQMLLENKIVRVMYEDESLTQEEATKIASESVALPGTSEHELGLAADIIDYYYPDLDEGQEDTDVQRWLMANSWRYGFILRYPNGSSDITGIIYEPWHYRYVGTEYAREIHERGITLEEFVALRRGR